MKTERFRREFPKEKFMGPRERFYTMCIAVAVIICYGTYHVIESLV